MEKKLIIVSNRLPLQLKKNNNQLEVQQSSGGLVSAINSIPRDNNLVWIGAADFTQEIWKEFQESGIKTDIEIVPVFLEKETEELYYGGFSNTIIWPLFHYFPSFAEYEEKYYRAYRVVNQQFADAVKSIASAQDTVWVHDYHLMLLPGYLKKGMKKVSSSFFLHIPFPTYELFKLVPEDWRHEILTSLLSCDVCGFQIQEHASHFKRALSYFLGLESMNNQVTLNGHVTLIKDYPISIDFEKFNRAFDDEKVKGIREFIRKKYQGIFVVFSLDRLDYSKGVHNRLQAFEQLLNDHKELHGRIVFIINVIPSRESIDKYAERKKLIEENISRINGLFGGIEWQPIIYQYRSMDFMELIGCYTGCDVALVTPLRDGMNLVAKEFVASRKDQKGTLILSEFAGAANEMNGAILVNPNDINNMKEAMLTAINFSSDEQKERMNKMQVVIRENNVTRWLTNFLDDVSKSKTETELSHPNIMNPDDKNLVLDAYRRAKHRLILLDYDGTLVPFYTKPQEAMPGDVIKELVSRLSRNPKNRVMLISGRDSGTLDTWFNGINIELVAEHGSMYKAKEEKHWKGVPDIPMEWKDEVRACIEKYVGMVPGSFMEEKKYSIAWHYRAIENIEEDAIKLSLSKELTLLNLNDSFSILQGNKVIEVKSSHVNKGRFIEGLMSANSFDFVLAIGDDITDEDMFDVLRQEHHYTIKVGLGSTAARYNLVGVNNVLSFLDQLSAVRDRANA
jgi:trehalose 6-phosphate synthase/phosphatase